MVDELNASIDIVVQLFNDDDNINNSNEDEEEYVLSMLTITLT
jgi:hypothetical protein